MKYYIKRNEWHYKCDDDGNFYCYVIFNDKDDSFLLSDGSKRKKIKKQLKRLNTYEKYLKHLDYLMNEDK